jgi:hypothetical protein
LEDKISACLLCQGIYFEQQQKNFIKEKTSNAQGRVCRTTLVSISACGMVATRKTGRWWELFLWLVVNLFGTIKKHNDKPNKRNAKTHDWNYPQRIHFSSQRKGC